MGHIRLGSLPRSRSWQEVVALIEHGAAVEQVAHATITAAQRGLRGAAKDQGVVESVWLLTQLPHAARAPAFEAALGACGLHVAGAPGLMTLAAAFSGALDRRLANNCGRTDLGEMAQMAAAETLVGVLSQRTQGLFDAGPDDLQRELARLTTVNQFGFFAEAFFGRFICKTLDYFLSRALYRHLGEGRHFVTLARVEEFSQALETHCLEAAAYVKQFSGEWTSATRWEHGEISREHARDLTHGAINKMVKELRLGAGLDEQ
jgi:hypothetical protein